MKKHEYMFSEQAESDGKVRLMWREDGEQQDPLDFWIIDASYVEEAKGRVRSGELEELCKPSN